MPGRPAECLVRLPRAAYATRRLTVRMCPGLRGRATDRTSGRRAAQRRLSRDRSPAQRIAAFDTCTCASGLPPVVRLIPARCHPSREGTSPADALQVRGRSLLGRSTLPAWLREGQDSPLASWPRAASDARASPPTRRLGRRRRLALAISRVLSGSGGEPLASRCLIGGAVQLRVE